ncbi:hypothetical protein AB4370_22305 [Vibrio cyclitrophicus]
MEIGKKIMIDKLTRELKTNEENIEAVVFLCEEAKRILSEKYDPTEILLLSDEICFWEDRLQKHKFERRTLILKMEKINDF